MAGLDPSSSHKHHIYRHMDKLPVLKEKNDCSVEDEKNEEVDHQGRKKNKSTSPASPPDQQQAVVSAPRGPVQGSSPSLRPNLYMTINQRRIFSLEPFHQSSIISSRQKRGREDEGEDEGRTGRPNKKVKPTNDLKKLKVRIELNGLRLNKPRLPGELGQWRPSGQKAADLDRKFSPVRERSEVNGSWSESRFLRRDGPREHTPGITPGDVCVPVCVYGAAEASWRANSRLTSPRWSCHTHSCSELLSLVPHVLIWILCSQTQFKSNQINLIKTKRAATQQEPDCSSS
ncbi:hypothetical protein CRENBAI_009941 [Crenichthys baileyi]|uniref:Uncharacterized protein n=1 Tax=Crenichthys baileyi TaxID=28760 RepID=A0AAV9SKY8_9TELE